MLLFRQSESSRNSSIYLLSRHFLSLLRRRNRLRKKITVTSTSVLDTIKINRRIGGKSETERREKRKRFLENCEFRHFTLFLRQDQSQNTLKLSFVGTDIVNDRSVSQQIMPRKRSIEGWRPWLLAFMTLITFIDRTAGKRFFCVSVAFRFALRQRHVKVRMELSMSSELACVSTE